MELTRRSGGRGGGLALRHKLAWRATIWTVALLASSLIRAEAQEACDQADLVITTTPAPSRAAGSVQRHLALIASAVQAVDLLLLGDSLAQGWPTDLAQTLTRSGRVANWGVGGDETQTVLWRLSAPQARGLAPKAIVLLLGANNLFFRGDKPCAIAAGIEAVLHRITELWPKTYVLLVEVTPTYRGDIHRENERLALNGLLRDMPNRKPRLVTVNGDDIFACDGKNACPNLAPDLLHFSAAGYQTLSARIRPVLEQIHD